MYANSTWLNCTTQTDKACAYGVHVHYKMNAAGIIGGHGMGGGDTTASLAYTLLFKAYSHVTTLLMTCVMDNDKQRNPRRGF